MFRKDKASYSAGKSPKFRYVVFDSDIFQVSMKNLQKYKKVLIS